MLISSPTNLHASAIDVQAKSIVMQSIDAVVDFYKKKADDAEARANTNIPVIGNVVKCNGCASVFKFWFETHTKGAFGAEKSIEEIDATYLPLFDEANKINDAIHEKNLPIIESNKVIVKKIIELMESVGIKSEYFKPIYSRSGTYKGTTTVPAGFIDDLNRIVCTSDGYEDDKQNIEYKLREYNRYKENRRTCERRKEEELREKELRDQKIKKFAVISSHYTDATSISSTELLSIILSKNEYLNLAYQMEMVRNEFLTGIAGIQTALQTLISKNQSDSNTQIESSVVQAMHAYCLDSDGRYFRDCEWNYSRLYELAKEQNPQLYSDYFEIVNMVGL
jgi:hypothetical protein